MKRRDDIRNVAIIAHVDHGKTTLVDAMLRQSGQYRASQLQGERILDSNDLERERGITILAKNIAIKYGDIKINLIDTPGHADFGGEVERTLQMADGALVLVDAFEGPDAADQVRAAQGVRLPHPADRRDQQDRPARCPADRGLNEIFDTFVEQGASEEQLDFPYIFASGKAGFASHDPHATSGDVKPLFDMIVGQRARARSSIPTARSACSARRSTSPNTSAGSRSAGSSRARQTRAEGRADQGRRRERQRLDRQRAGLRQAGPHRGRSRPRPATSSPSSGLGRVDIGDTIADPEHPVALPRIEVDEPTLSMLFTRQRLAADRRGPVPHLAAPQGAARPRARVERRPARRAQRRTRRVHRSPAAGCCISRS